jgi:glucose/arabinose dehydrogenase
MPAVPTEKKQTVTTATGKLSVVMQVAEGRNESLFVVSYCDFPTGDLKNADLDKRLDQARDGAISSARGKKRSEEAIQLGAYPGREIVIEKDGEIVAKMRIYLAKNRLYQVMVLGAGPVFASKDTATFLDSFRLNE